MGPGPQGLFIFLNDEKIIVQGKNSKLYLENTIMFSDEIIEVNLNTWKISKRLKAEKGPYNVEISPDGNYMVATLKSSGSTAVWNLKDLSLLKIIKNSSSVSHGIAISTDSKYAFISVEGIGGDPGIIDVIQLNNQTLIDKVEIGKQAGGIAFWKKEL